MVPPPLPVIGGTKKAPAKIVPKKTLVFNSDDDSDDDTIAKPIAMPKAMAAAKPKNNLFGDSDEDVSIAKPSFKAKQPLIKKPTVAFADGSDSDDMGYAKKGPAPILPKVGAAKKATA